MDENIWYEIERLQINFLSHSFWTNLAVNFQVKISSLQSIVKENIYKVRRLNIETHTSMYK